MKLKSGGTLTDEELAYLKKNNPQMYQDAVAVEKERENYKRRLNQCRSKEEVEKFKVLEMNGALSEAKSIMHNPRIPEAEKVKLMDRILARTMGIQAEHMTFVKSPAYIRLPDREADALKKKGRGKTQQPAELPAVEDRRDTQEEQELPDISEIPETPELPGMAEQEDTAASETELSGAQPHTDLAEAAYSKLKAAIRGKKA